MFEMNVLKGKFFTVQVAFDSVVVNLGEARLTVPKKWRTVLVNWGLKKEVVLNGLKGPESDFGGSKIRTDS